MDILPQQRVGKIIFFTGIAINLIVLDLVVISNYSKNKVMVSQVDSKTAISVTPIKEITPTQIPSLTPIPIESDTYSKSATREIYIPIGSGTTKNSTWDGLEGVEINIDTAKYGNIKESYFQVALRIPTANGEVFAKLYNETDKHDVWFSEMSSEGSTAVLKEAKISLDNGAKLYRVYLKSTLEAEAVVDLSRIKIIYE